MMAGVEVHAVIAPSPAPGEFVDGHQLDVRNPEVHQMIEPRNGPLEGPSRGEGADMQFVDHCRGQGRRLPALILPGEGWVIDHPGRTVHAVWLPRGTGVGKRLATIQAEGILASRSGCGDVGSPPAALAPSQWEARTIDLHVDPLGHGGPHAKQRHTPSPSFASRATGALPRSSAKRTSPPLTVSLVSALCQRPAGKVSVVSPHQPPSPRTK